LKLREGAPVSIAGAEPVPGSSTAAAPLPALPGGGTSVIAPANAAPGKADAPPPASKS
jgi:hypothetical protein